MTDLPSNGGNMDTEGVRERRTRLVAAGWDFFPERTGRKNSSKSVGTWVGKRGSFDPAADYSDRFGTLWNDALYLHEVFGFDVDVDDAHWAGQITSTMDTMLGRPLCRRYRANSPRTLSLYGAPADAEYVALKGSDGGIEVLTGENTKAAAFGYHTNPITRVRSRLEWDGVPGNVRKADLSPITLAQRDLFLEEVTEMLGDEVDRIVRSNYTGEAVAGLASDIDQLYEATLWIPNTGHGGWDEWNKMGMALFAGSGGAELGLAAFVAWTAKNPHADPKDCQERWDAYQSAPPSRIGAGTIFRLAMDQGYTVDRQQSLEKKIMARMRKYLHQRNAAKHPSSGDRGLE